MPSHQTWLHSKAHEIRPKLGHLNADIYRMPLSIAEIYFVIFDNSAQQNNSSLLDFVLTCVHNK